MRAELVEKLKHLLENMEDAEAAKADVDALEDQFQRATKNEADASEKADDEAGEEANAAAPAAEAVTEEQPQAAAAEETNPAPQANAAASAAEEVAEEQPQAAAAQEANAAPQANAAAPAAEEVAEEQPQAAAADETNPAPQADAAASAAEEVAEEQPQAAAANEAETGKEDAVVAEFNALLHQYREAVGAQRKARKAQLEANIAAKREVLTQLESLIKEEENIGRLFQHFRDLQDKWKEIGQVPAKVHGDLQRDYSKLIEDFYYNVRIYKELKEHDLKRNLELKQAVIKRMVAVAAETSIRKAEEQARLLLEEWDEIGPTYQEEWEKIREEFRTAADAVFGRVREYYQGLREEQKANLDAKTELCQQIEGILEDLPRTHKKWMERSSEVIALQQKWKDVGFASKKANEKIWERFRGACNKFFDAKSDFYKGQRAQNNEHKEAKEALIAQANELKDSTDWKATSDKLIKLQKDWQKIGPAHQRDEQRLWKQFREACDAFFNAKKKHFSSRDAEQQEALAAKDALLKELEAANPEGREAIFEAIKQFRDRWNAIGHVPFKHKDRVANAYSKGIDALYDKLDVDRKEREKIKFNARIENLTSAGQDATYALRKEKSQLRDKMDRLKSTITQYENNLGFFAMAKGKEADKMKAEVQGKIEANQKQLKALKEQIKQIDLAMRKAKQEAESGEEQNA